MLILSYIRTQIHEMKTWTKLLVVLVFLGVSGAETTPGCDLDLPGLSKHRSYSLAMDRFEPCIQATFNKETRTTFRKAKSLENFRDFFRDVCPQMAEMVTCMAGARATLQTCHNKNATVRPMLFSEIVENILPDGCENGGERLAYLAHGFFLLEKHETFLPLKRCLIQVMSLVRVANNADVDLTSEMYATHKTLRTLRNCMQHVEYDAYKPALEWLLTEGLHHYKCQHPEQDTLVPCEEIDVTKVPVPSICDMEPLNTPHLYDKLEDVAMECDAQFVIGDSRDGTDTGIEELMEQYKIVCTNRSQPFCLAEISISAEACLPPGENRQFQLFMQSLEDIWEACCVEKGARMAKVMQQMYQQIPGHGHPLRDCYKHVSEARKTQHHNEHAMSTKNMRFYHEMTAIKACNVEKLHANNETSKDMENLMDDILRNMKCVKPEDDTVVVCETIHGQ